MGTAARQSTARPEVAIVHPLALGGVAGAFVAAAMAAFWGIGRMRWLAWAHVPGASRLFASETEARRAFPRHRVDRALLIMDDVLLAAGGLAIVTIVDTDFARTLVGERFCRRRPLPCRNNRGPSRLAVGTTPPAL